MRRANDNASGDLFGRFPQPADLSSELVNLKVQIAARMSAAMKTFAEERAKEQLPGDRYEVAARMSRMLAPREVTKNILDAYASGGKVDHVPNLAFAIAFDAATETNALLDLFASLRGCGVLVGSDNLRAELILLQREEHDLKKKKRALQKAIDRSGR